MNLRDEILNDKKRKEEQKKEDKIKQNENEQKELQAARLEYQNLSDKLAKGDVPEDWKKLYDEYIEKIKPNLKESDSDSFSFEFKVAKELYEKYFYPSNTKLSEFSRGKLLNEYLNKRFKSEGFFNAKFNLVEEVKYYPTDSEQRAYDAAMQTYNSEYARWYANEPSSSREVIAGEIVVRKNPYKKPVQPVLHASNAEYSYYIRISGSLTDKPASKPKFDFLQGMSVGQFIGSMIGGILVFAIIGFIVYLFKYGG